MSELYKIIAASLCVAFIACAKPPTEKLQQAESAVETTREGGQRYAQDEFQALERKLADARTEVAAQNDKTLGRDFGNAEKLLDEVIADAQKITPVIEQRKMEEKTKATQALEAARELTTKVRSLYENLGSQDATILSDYRGRVEGLNAELTTIQSAIEGGDFVEAAQHSTAVQQKAQALLGDLERIANTPNEEAPPGTEGEPGKPTPL